MVALADAGRIDDASAVHGGIDRHYLDPAQSDDGVASQLLRQLADPRPADIAVTKELDRYKSLDRRWHDWNTTVEVCRDLASRMLEAARDAPQ